MKILFSFAIFIATTALLRGYEVDKDIQVKEEELHSTEILLKENEEIGISYFVSYRDKEFIVLPGVFSPAVFNNTYFFADNIELKPQESFLEVGSGTGLIAVMAAINGADNVVAVDINPYAVKNTLANAKLHGVDSKMLVLQSDIFDSIPLEQKFDTIFWNAPFMHNAKEDLSYLEQALYDPYYKCLNRYFREAGSWLKPQGRVLIGFSSTNGHMEVFESIAKAYGWKLRLIAEQHTLIPQNGEEKGATLISEQLWEATQ